MFANEASLFFEHKDIKILLSTVNRELYNIDEWFTSTKLSLNLQNEICNFS